MNMRGLYLGALLALASGCAVSPEAAEPPCRRIQVGFERPFGRRFLHFFGMVEDAPSVVANDAVRGSKSTAHNWDRYQNVKQREWEITSDRVRNLFPAMGDDFADRSERLSDRASNWSENLAEDWRCFVARAWYSLKMAE